MIEFVNRNLSPRIEPEYFYRVAILLTTFEKDINKTEPFFHFEDFKGTDLLALREQAILYSQNTINNIENEGKFFLPLANYEDFEFGKNAAYSVFTYFVVSEEGEEEDEYCILGDSDDEINDGLEIEEMVYKEKGILIS